MKIKLSPVTLQLLKNFSVIGQNMQFKAGTTVKTISPQKNVLAIGEINETIPHDFAIYDLGRLLGILSMFDNPELDLGEKSILIDGKVDYKFADPSMIVAPPDKDLAFPEPDVSFALNTTDLREVTRFAQALSVPHVCVEGKDGKINLVATDLHNVSCDKWENPIGETDLTFNFVFTAGNVHKCYAGDYTIEITSKGISKWSHSILNLQYFLATESDSTFGG